MTYNLLGVGKGLLLDFVLLFLLLSLILLSVKFPQKYGSTVALSAAAIFFLFGAATIYRGHFFSSMFGLETTLRAKFEAAFAASDKYGATLSSMTYEEALSSLPLSNIFKDSLKEFYSTATESTVTLGAFAANILAERTASLVPALFVGLLAGLIAYIAVAIVFVKINLWGNIPNTGEHIGGIFARCIVFMFLILYLTLIPSLEWLEFLDTSLVFRWLFSSVT